MCALGTHKSKKDKNHFNGRSSCERLNTGSNCIQFGDSLFSSVIRHCQGVFKSLKILPQHLGHRIHSGFLARLMQVTIIYLAASLELNAQLLQSFLPLNHNR